MKTDAQLINQTSGAVEYYTPQPIIEVARSTMGGIHLDPATSEAANQRVDALSFFTEAVDGLSQNWHGHVWMNHPFGRAEEACGHECEKKHTHHSFPYHGNAAWITKLEREFTAGRVTQACCITFACTSEKWFQPLLRRPQCFLSPRTNYILPDGSLLRGVTKGSVVTYYGHNADSFGRNFRELGVVKIPYLP